MRNQLSNGYERNYISTNYENELRSIILLEPTWKNIEKRREKRKTDKCSQKIIGVFLDFSFSRAIDYLRS